MATVLLNTLEKSGFEVLFHFVQHFSVDLATASQILVYIKNVRYLHKKSQGAISGEHAGHFKSPLKEIRRSEKC